MGASLPIIGTLNNLILSGDSINKIQAVLSGTLNFVFNQYNGTVPFAQVVRQAQVEGYTEPDPRMDLGGTDVMRKIMILAREAGNKIEMSDIENEGFLPASCFDGSVEDFYKEMEKQEPHFKKIYDAAAAKNCKLKFVANFENDANGKGVAKVGLQHIEPSSDFYHLYGKDNLVLFYSGRYPELPLVVKGAGAGADVTVHDPKAIAPAKKRFPALGFSEDIEGALKGAELVLHLTEWKVYRELDPAKMAKLVASPIIIDGRNALDREAWVAAGWKFRALGRAN